jgi:hypothetical protein
MREKQQFTESGTYLFDTRPTSPQLSYATWHSAVFILVSFCKHHCYSLKLNFQQGLWKLIKAGGSSSRHLATVQYGFNTDSQVP